MNSAKADSGECVSAASNITDEWCQAVKCAQVYIDSGHCKFKTADDDSSKKEEDKSDSSDEKQDDSSVRCSDIWSETKVYTKGNSVSYKGKQWEAAHWTQGNIPGSGGEWGPWRNPKACKSAEDKPKKTLELLKKKD